MSFASSSAATWRFGRQTVVAAARSLEVDLTHAQLTSFLVDLGPGFARRVPPSSVNLKTRLNELIVLLDSEPATHDHAGHLVADAVVKYAVKIMPQPVYGWDRPSESRPEHADLLRALDQDGFKVADNIICRALPTEVELPQAENEIERLLREFDFAILKGHLDQARAAHGRGEWASANGQLRAFYEGLFDDIARTLDPGASALPSSENRRARLAQIGFLDEGLNEWSGDGKNFVNGLFKRLHPQGAHPGLSDQEDSTFRLHIVLLTARLMLARLEARTLR